MEFSTSPTNYVYFTSNNASCKAYPRAMCRWHSQMPANQRSIERHITMRKPFFTFTVS